MQTLNKDTNYGFKYIGFLSNKISTNTEVYARPEWDLWACVSVLLNVYQFCLHTTGPGLPVSPMGPGGPLIAIWENKQNEATVVKKKMPASIQTLYQYNFIMPSQIAPITDYCDEIVLRALYFTSCTIYNRIFFGAVPLWQFGVQAARTHPRLLKNSLCLSFLSWDCWALLTVSTKAELQVSKQEKDSQFIKSKLYLLFAVTV